MATTEVKPLKFTEGEAVGTPSALAVYVGDGTASSPIYSFSLDTNTGMYRIGADILGFATNGTERVRIDAQGRVGIGVTPNNRALHIRYSAGGVHSPATNGNAELLWVQNPDNVAVGEGTMIRLSGQDTVGGQEKVGVFGTLTNASNLSDFAWLLWNGSAYIEHMRLAQGGALVVTSLAGKSAEIPVDGILRSDTHNTDDLGTDAIEWRYVYAQQFLHGDSTTPQMTIATTSDNGNINLEPHGTGKVTVNKGFEVTGTTSYLKIPSLTTAQRDALDAENGMVIYNSDTGQQEAYQGSWVGYGLPLAAGTHAISAAYTILDDDGYKNILCTAGADGFTVTLPTASANTNRIITIKKIDAGAGAITIDGEGAETIDGAATTVIGPYSDASYTGKGAYLTLLCDGTAWHVVGCGGDVIRIASVTTPTNSANATYSDAGSKSIPPGKWQFHGGAYFIKHDATSQTNFQVGVTTSSESGAGYNVGLGTAGILIHASHIADNVSLSIPGFVAEIASATTYYLGYRHTYGGGQAQYTGHAFATRVL